MGCLQPDRILVVVLLRLLLAGAVLCAGVGVRSACGQPAGGTAQEAAPTRAAPTRADLDRLMRPQFGTLLALRTDSIPIKAAFAPDPVQHALATGAWTHPDPDRPLEGWLPLEPDARGLYRADAPAVYAAGTFEANVGDVVLLMSGGCRNVWVNGHRVIGRRQKTNHDVMTPIRLRAGTNEFLFQADSAPFAPRIFRKPQDHFISPIDAVLPDVIRGEPGALLASVLVYNCTTQWAEGMLLQANTTEGRTLTRVPAIPPLTFQKVPFSFEPDVSESGEKSGVVLALVGPGGGVVHRQAFELRVRGAGEPHRRTFRSRIDNSVQWYAALPPASRPLAEQRLALVTALHSAETDPEVFLSNYSARDWCWTIAPMGRRPRGGNFNEWARVDVLEALRDAEKLFNTDPDRRCLTGHSMGGHGTWHLGWLHPNRFAALAPVCAYRDVWREDTPGPPGGAPGIAGSLRRAANPLVFATHTGNLMDIPIHVIHTDTDEDVPVAHSRRAVELLAGNKRLTYTEHSGKPHWWGPGTVDNNEVFSLFRRARRGRSVDVPVRFTTCSPAIASDCAYISVNTQARSLEPSAVESSYSRGSGELTISTENIAHLSIDDGYFEDRPLGAIVIDGQRVPAPADAPATIHLALGAGGAWSLAGPPDPWTKNPERAGPFKDVFRNGFVFVVGTRGTEEENAWALERAVYDAQAFWYLQNATPRVFLDTAFDPEAHPDCSVVLYGNASTNGAWGALLPDSPVRPERGVMRVGGRELIGETLSALFVRPRPGSERALVGVIGGTGIVGMRATDPLFWTETGVSLPDWIVFDARVWVDPARGLLGAGYFDASWDLREDDSVWNERGVGGRGGKAG